MTEEKDEVVVPVAFVEMVQLYKAGQQMIDDLKSDKKDKAIRDIGKGVESDLALAEKLAKRDSVKNFIQELRDVLVLPQTPKIPMASLVTAFLLRPR